MNEAEILRARYLKDSERKVFIVKTDEDREPLSLDETMNSVQILLRDYEDVIAFIEELGYEQRPDSAAMSTRELIEEMLADLLDLVGYEYTGSAKYAIKRLFRNEKTRTDTNTEGEAD